MAVDPVVLYDSSRTAVSNYEDLMDPKNLMPGSKLQFSDGTVIEILRYINSGGADHIYEIAGGKVIRVPRVPRTLTGFHDINKQFDYALIQASGIPHVRLYPEESRLLEF